MKNVKWDTRPYDEHGNQQKDVLARDIAKHSFDEPLQQNHVVELQSTVQEKTHRVRVRIKDPTDPHNVIGAVGALSADPSHLMELGLAHCDEVAFSRDKIFLRVFDD